MTLCRGTLLGPPPTGHVPRFPDSGVFVSPVGGPSRSLLEVRGAPRVALPACPFFGFMVGGFFVLHCHGVSGWRVRHFGVSEVVRRPRPTQGGARKGKRGTALLLLLLLMLLLLLVLDACMIETYQPKSWDEALDLS